EKAAITFKALVPQSIEDVLDNGGNTIQLFDSITKQALEKKDDGLFIEEESIDFGQAVPRPGKIICVGTNYQKHAEESNMPIPEYPLLFNKFDNTVSAH